MKRSKRNRVHVIINGRLVHPSTLQGCKDENHPSESRSRECKGEKDESGRYPYQRGFSIGTPYWIEGASIWKFDSGDLRIKRSRR